MPSRTLRIDDLTETNKKFCKIDGLSWIIQHYRWGEGIPVALVTLHN